MSDLYELKSTDGKGLGAIAKQNIKRGTLILEEKPQISDDGSDIGKFFIKSTKFENFIKTFHNEATYILISKAVTK